mmetsp:Transcript_38397/g.102948  ORF Transcript_38397/g.102948 Transcript_38397/m.102948 type:complete len:479 (+) Transcript_38397:106-1542(+)
MSFLCGLPICRNRSSASPVDTGAVPLPAGGELSKRIARSGSSDVMIEYVHSLKGRNATSTQVFQAGDHVSRGNVATDMMVVRGPDWKWENEDGGAGKPGRILSVSRSSQTATVHWQATGVVESHYRLGRRGQCDLCHTKGFTGPSRSKIMAAFKGFTSSARNSQTTFADREQTVIILDWDDTLFPSTFVRSDMRMTLGLPLRHQKLSEPVKRQVARSLAECAAKADKLLRLCASYGNLVIVTLARANWVTDCCGCFYPGIGELLRQLNVKIVYAQEGVTIDQKKVQAMNVQQCEMFWGAIKGRAISDEIKSFYSQYEGQSWKNIISIGDSNFEKIGTMNATAEYMRENGIEVPSDLASPATESGPAGFRPSEATTAVVEGHAFHVRTKVAKMLDEPTVDELQVELELMRQWLPLMVKHDGGFSMDLDGLKGWEEATAIEQALREPRPAGAPERGPPRLLGAQGRSGSTTSSSPKAVSL